MNVGAASCRSLSGGLLIVAASRFDGRPDSVLAYGARESFHSRAAPPFNTDASELRPQFVSLVSFTLIGLEGIASEIEVRYLTAPPTPLLSPCSSPTSLL